jgi:hypothetical protein
MITQALGEHFELVPPACCVANSLVVMTATLTLQSSLEAEQWDGLRRQAPSILSASNVMYQG